VAGVRRCVRERAELETRPADGLAAHSPGRGALADTSRDTLTVEEWEVRVTVEMLRLLGLNSTFEKAADDAAPDWDSPFGRDGADMLEVHEQGRDH
jgi:hypothetical protein